MLTPARRATALVEKMPWPSVSRMRAAASMMMLTVSVERVCLGLFRGVGRSFESLGIGDKMRVEETER